LRANWRCSKWLGRTDFECDTGKQRTYTPFAEAFVASDHISNDRRRFERAQLNKCAKASQAQSVAETTELGAAIESSTRVTVRSSVQERSGNGDATGGDCA
jgi:hypothetical protein